MGWGARRCAAQSSSFSICKPPPVASASPRHLLRYPPVQSSRQNAEIRSLAHLDFIELIVQAISTSFENRAEKALGLSCGGQSCRAFRQSVYRTVKTSRRL